MIAACPFIIIAGTIGAPRFVDMTDGVGLGPGVIPETVSLLCFAELNGDGRPDAVINRHRVFLNQTDSASPIGRRFVEVDPATTGLVKPDAALLIAFADLDNDGRADAIVSESIDSKNEKWIDHGRRTGWQRGRGDGTFEPRQPLPTPPRTTAAIAIGDVNLDGRLDLYLGNWYVRYGESPGWPNDLLLTDGQGSWTRQALPEDSQGSADERDRGGRPTFGAIIAHGLFGPGAPGAGVALLELNYGRRWNRAWLRTEDGQWVDVAPRLGLDGDHIRHGQYPAWLKERAKTDSRFDRQDEPPWRSNGNTFDGAIGDIDNDGDLDLFISEIAHGWAGDSSDRTRALFAQPSPGGLMEFATGPQFNVDRIPPAPPDHPDGSPAQHNWNMGDLYCDLADLDHDGRLDLIIASGDYPDNQRLRIYLQQPPGGVRDATTGLGIDHDGSAQISLADVDGDGDLDLLVGQTFNRYKDQQIAGRNPRLRLFINEATSGRKSLALLLRGGGEACSRDALGAIVSARVGGTTMTRALIGVGGRAGKQNQFIVHFGLGDADHVDALNITWPDAQRTVQRFERVGAGRYQLTIAGNLVLEKD